MTMYQLNYSAPARACGPSRASGRVIVSTSSRKYKSTSSDYVSKFHALLQKWRSETAFISDPETIISHPSFREIVVRAKIVKKLIADDLRKAPSPLVWALDEAYGFQPYEIEVAGDIEKMSEAWISWIETN